MRVIELNDCLAEVSKTTTVVVEDEFGNVWPVVVVKKGTLPRTISLCLDSGCRLQVVDFEGDV